MGLSDSEITKIVKDYRENNPNIVRYWYALENACINAINGGGETKLARGIKIRCERAMLIITLPSGRELFYQKPQIVNNRFGKKSIGYWGVGSTEKAGVRKWSLVETYGGRLAENCLGGDTLVLTDNGWKKITDVLLSDLLWNGKKWVTHEGVIYKGIQKTICIEGIRATPDHKILTKRGWENASSYKRHNRRSPRLPDGFRLCGVRRTEKPVALSMRRQRHSYLYKKRFSEKSQLRLSVENSYSKCKSNPWYAPAPRILGMEVSVRPLSLADTSGLEKLWRTRYNSLQTLGRKFREFLGRYGGGLQTRSYTRQNKQQRKLRAVKLLLGYSQNSKQQQTLQYNNRYTSRKNDGGTGGRYFGNRTNNHSLSDRTRRVGGAFIRQTRRSEQVFDILNCKDGHCFTVMGETGISLLSHNCTQAVARDLLYFSLRTLAENGEEVVCHIHDECVVETKSSAERISALMSLAPDWADGLPLRAEGYECEFYEKQ